MMESNHKAKVPLAAITSVSSMENRRRKNVTIRKPIILGTYAFMLSIAEQKKRGDNATHSWTCFLRSPDNEDISYYVKKVVFSLHPSFLNPNRIVEKCPFEVTECGWGEFDIMAKVYFVDSSEKPVEIKHFLRLYPPGTTDVRSVKFPTDSAASECVASETHDEFIFFEPTEKFYEKLMAGPIQPMAQHRLQQFFHKTDKTTFEKTLAAAHVSIQNEMASLRAEIAQITLDIQNIRENYYSLRPSEVASIFPPTIADQSPVSETKSSQSLHQQVEGNLQTGMLPQKTEMFGRSPSAQRHQQKFQTLQNVRTDFTADGQIQPQGVVDQLHQFDAGGLGQVPSHQLHQDFQIHQQHGPGHPSMVEIPSLPVHQGYHSSQGQNHYDGSQLLASQPGHTQNLGSSPIDGGVSSDPSHHSQFQVLNQTQVNRNGGLPNSITTNNHFQPHNSDMSVPPKVEPQVMNPNIQ
ncbi:putative Gas41 [Cryptosporidium felis]|nr:putative Gas41 [Cryptosporidium felis]